MDRPADSERLTQLHHHWSNPGFLGLFCIKNYFNFHELCMQGNPEANSQIISISSEHLEARYV